MTIVIIKDGDAVTTTLAIAEGTLNDHASVIKLVRTYQADLEEFGLLDFKSESTGGRPTEYAFLNEPQSTLLLTYMRNTDIVRAFKKKLVREFWEMVQQRNQRTPSLPADYIGALEHLLASKRSEKLAIEQRDHAIETKAEIGSRREATAMATASAAVRQVSQLKEELGRGLRQATVTAVEKISKRKFGKQGFRPLKNWCAENGIQAPKVHDPRYGWVRSWPAAAWAAVYHIDLAELFGADGEQA
ncbi:Rha family transcriptional regulator [Pseudomonas sp. MF6787]|uniref:Rha family transcriptional regulator n=1 Tax=Pseudomonas sp. MF6787 TaxID=2797536 RepID=UPI0018E80706|nr:Rha family transcriptional regulator [Pseudomonas sp. MF6787]MBJ2263703.1 Rha family transcriptional regulator [Pseudomonas sp. MF6787]